MRVLLADGHPWLCSALQLFFLEYEPLLEIVGAVNEAGMLLTIMPQVAPDLLLLDWELPGLTKCGTYQSLLSWLYQQHPQLYLIVLSVKREHQRVALAAGAHAFVCKAEPPEQLLTAVRHAQQDFNGLKAAQLSECPAWWRPGWASN